MPKREPHPAQLPVRTPDEHRQRHVDLHRALDELLADWMSETGHLPSQSSVLQLLTWSAIQTTHPSDTRGHYETRSVKLDGAFLYPVNSPVSVVFRGRRYNGIIGERQYHCGRPQYAVLASYEGAGGYIWFDEGELVLLTPNVDPPADAPNPQP